jgi:ribosomal protein L13E
MKAFDWHSGDITCATPITKSYRNTQKVRRFFKAECGDGFRFDVSFMAWLKAATGRTMGEAVDERRRREAEKT